MAFADRFPGIANLSQFQPRVAEPGESGSCAVLNDRNQSRALDTLLGGA
jgi:hypothetical protein